MKFDLNFSERRTFFRMFAWRCEAFVDRTRRIDPKAFGLFRKIEKDSGGSVSSNTQPNRRAIFDMATAHLSPSFFVFFARLTFSLPVCKWARITAFTSRFWCVELTFGRMPIITRWFGANTFQVVFAQLSSEPPRWTPHSQILFLDTLQLLCVGGSEDWAVSGVGFARSSASCRKLHVSSRTLSFLLSIDGTPCPLPTPRWPLRFVTTVPMSFFSFLASKFRSLSSWWTSMSYYSNTVLSWSDSRILNASSLVVHQPCSAGADICTQLYIPIQFCKIDTREDANTHSVISYKYLSNRICTVWLPPLKLLFSRHTSTSWILRLRGWSGFRCRFLCTIDTLMPETPLVSLRTLAFLFPLVACTISSFNSTPFDS